MIDRLRQLAIFAKVLDHGSFRKAASELRLSPSVVSHHITQLEEYLGVALIYRSTRRLNLTKEGAQLLATTQSMLKIVETDLAQLTSNAREPSGEIRLTAPSVLSQSEFTDAICRFSDKYPKIKMYLDFTDTKREMIKEGYDVAIRMGVERKHSPNSKLLFKVGRKMVASSHFIANAPTASQPVEISDWPWLVLAPVENVPLCFSKAGDKKKITLKPKAQITTNDAQALYRLSKAGSGIAVVPEFLATEDVASGLVSWVLPQWQLNPISVYATWPSNAPKDGVVKLLIKELSASLSSKTEKP